MIRDINTATEALADAIWWFKGFAAARPPSMDEGSGEHVSLEGKLREVRQFLNALEEARFRRLGDEKAIVIAYAEFERFVDAARPDATWQDLKSASDTAKAILEAYRHEAESARNLNIPF